MREIYIQSAKQISMQAPLSEEWMQQPVWHQEPFVQATNPVFRDYMAANEARRMGGLMKRALVTTLKVLSDTGIEHPDAIITGTCLGSLDYTERLLSAMTENGEEALSPTYFMQSTHNTVSSALAIYTKTKGYNSTYSHGTMSFDLTVLDAWMQMQLGKINTALVGGHDEMTEPYFLLLQKAGYVGCEGMVPCSEVAMSMLLTTDKHADNLCELASISIGTHPDIDMHQVDVIMTGVNGQPANDALYQQLLAEWPEKPHVQYKHLFGENYTASALGLYAAAHCLKQGTIPPFMQASPLTPLQQARGTSPITHTLRNILFVNAQADSTTYILLKAV